MKLGVGLAVFVAAVLVASQVLLPILAESQVRDELRGAGDVTSVEVHAFPALKLLGKRADSVRVRLRSATIGTGDLGDRLASTRRTDRLDLSIGVFTLGPLQAHDVTLRKRGDVLTGSASLRAADFPASLGLRPIASDNGALVVEGSFGPVSARARVSTAPSCRTSSASRP